MTPIMYFIGIALVIVSGIILKKTKAFAGDPAPFVMELPQYHVPAVKGVLLHMWERVKSFIIKAGTIIFVSSALIWFLSSFGFTDSGFGMVDINDSMLAAIGSFIAPIFIPLGFGTWEAVAGTISGLIAKENVVSTLGVLLNVGADAAEDDPSLLMAFTTMLSSGVAAFSFLTFNLYCIPCFAAVGTIRREMNNGKWFAFALCYQVVLAYVLSLMIYQIIRSVCRCGWVQCLDGHCLPAVDRRAVPVVPSGEAAQLVPCCGACIISSHSFQGGDWL